LSRTDRGSRDASAGESANPGSGAGLFGRNRGKQAAAAPEVRSKALAATGPASVSPGFPGPLGYVFRDIPNFSDNQDRILVIQRHKHLALGGVHTMGGTPSQVANSAVKWMTDFFFQYLYQFLHEKAQRRDGYRSTDAPPLTNVYMPFWQTELAMVVKINAMVMATLESLVFTNEGTRTMLTAFSGVKDRINRILDASNQLMIPDGYMPIVDYWATVYTPFVGGPVVYNLFDLKTPGDTLSIGTGSYSTWSDGTRPDLTTAADVAKILSDLELALSQLLNRNVAAAGSKLADFDKWMSLLSMTGMGMPQATPKNLVVDLVKWKEQFELDAFHFFDNKGAGTDTFVCWPDIRGDYQTLLQVEVPEGVTLDDLFWIGGKGLYAFDLQSDDTPGYSALANNNAGFGLVADTAFTTATGRHIEKYYTKEDGWISSAISEDATSASGCQAYMWSYPILSLHPQSWRFIMSEETEEAYLAHLRRPGFQAPFDIWGQAFRKWSHDVWGLPYIT